MFLRSDTAEPLSAPTLATQRRNAVQRLWQSLRLAMASAIALPLISGAASGAIALNDSFDDGLPLSNGGVGADWVDRSQAEGFRVPPTEAGSAVVLPDAVGDWNASSIRTQDAFNWGGSTVTVTLKELQFGSASGSADRGAGFIWDGHAAISLTSFSNAQLGPSSYKNDGKAGLTIEIGDNGSMSGFAISVPGSGNNSSSVVTGAAFDSYIGPSNPLQIAITTAADGAFSVQFNRPYGGGLTAPLAGNALGALTSPMSSTFAVSLGSQGIGATEMAAVFDSVVVDDPAPLAAAPTAVINRQTGEIALINETSTAIALAGYQLSSASGTLNATGWNSIAGTRDGAGNGSVDSDVWSITSETSAALAEKSAATAAFAIGQSISLGSAYLSSRYEDVQLKYSLDGINYLNANAEYIGTPLSIGDFNADGALNAADWAVFVSNYGKNLGGGSIAEARVKGDMNDDKAIRLADFRLFAAAYAAANPGAAPLSLPVPEPASQTLAIVAGALAITRRRRTGIVAPAKPKTLNQKRATQRTRVAVALAGALAILSASAKPAVAAVTFDDHFTNGDVLNNGGIGGDWTNVAQGGFNTPPSESGTVVTLPDGTGGWNMGGMRTTDGFAWGGSTVTVTLNDLTFANSASTTDRGAGFPWPGHAVVSIFDSANSKTNPGAYHNQLLPAMTIEIGTDGTQYGFGIATAAGGDTASTLLSGGKFDSAFNPASPLAITIQTAADGGFSVSFNKTYGGGLSTPIAGNAVGGLSSVPGFTFDVVLGAQGVNDSDALASFDRVVVDEPTSVAAPTLQINTTTGAVKLINRGTTPISLSSYELESVGGALKAGGIAPGDYSGNGQVDGADFLIWQRTLGTSVAAGSAADGSGNGVIDAADLAVWKTNFGQLGGGSGGWNSLDDQNLDSTGPGLSQGWAELGAPSATLLAEAFLTGSTSWDPNEMLNLGNAFQIGGAQDVVFRYATAGGPGVVTGHVEYVTGSIVAVPEPCGAILASAGVGLFVVFRRRHC